MAARISNSVCLLFRNFPRFQLKLCFYKNIHNECREFLFRSKRARSFSLSSTAHTENDTDYRIQRHEHLYASEKVQQLLLQMTGFNMQKAFRLKYSRMKEPTYKFMTNAELKQAQQEAEARGRKKLFMPPYLRRKESVPETLSKDPEIQGLISNNIVFVDIRPDYTNKSRTIVVRQPDGLLREATRNERYRVNQAFYPIRGREIEMPGMFQPSYLQDVLNREQYLFVLDRACIQFEPDDPEFARVTETTFKHIDEKKNYDVLRSTRHFGQMAFFLVLEENIEGLLVDMIQRLLVDDAISLVHLYCIVHKPKRWITLEAIEDQVQLLKTFAEEDYKRTGKLELVIQSLKEKQMPVRETVSR